MEKPLFEVQKTGLFSTFQDLGRFGYQKYGVPVSGAMDSYALKVGNLLVGNRPSEAGLEITMIGPMLKVLSHQKIAITGANLNPMINNKPAPMWQSFFVNKGDIITFNGMIEGVRSYLVVAGGFDIPEQMNSKSTYNRANLGRPPLAIGETIYKVEDKVLERKRIGLSHCLIPRYNKQVDLRVVLGPHDHHFVPDSLQAFFETEYRIKQADRMGCRLQSDKVLIHREKADIISDAIPLGGIQVPPNGQPIILMADRQTTGGYTRLGSVISVDMPKLSQSASGTIVRFKKVSIEEAQALSLSQERFFQHLSFAVKDVLQI